MARQTTPPQPHPGHTPNVTRNETRGNLIMQPHAHTDSATPAEFFPTDPSGLPEATRPELVELADGGHLDLRVAPVAKRLGDTTVRMLGYNGSIPGPTLKVQQDSEVVEIGRAHV